MFRNSANYHQFNQANGLRSGEFPSGASMTVPDQTLSLRDLVERHMRGQYVPQKTAQYEKYVENAQFPDVTKLTKIELQNLNLELQGYIKSTYKTIQGYVQSQENKKQGIANEKITDQTPEPNEGNG